MLALDTYLPASIFVCSCSGLYSSATKSYLNFPESLVSATSTRHYALFFMAYRRCLTYDWRAAFL